MPSNNNVPVKVFECCESSLAGEAAPVVGSSLEVLDEILLACRCESAMFAGDSPSGNMIGGRCFSVLLLFTPSSHEILEQVVFCGLTWSNVSLIGNMKCACLRWDRNPVPRTWYLVEGWNMADC